MMVRFDKDSAGLVASKSLFGRQIFTREMEGYLDELVWAFLRKGMKVEPHRHSQKEVYMFVKGRGTMQVDDDVMPVQEQDIVFIPSNSMHTAWNEEDTDLEFIIVRSKNMASWLRKIVRKLSD